MLTVAALIYSVLLVHARAMRFRGAIAALGTITIVDLWSHLGFSFPSLGRLEALPLALVAACVLVDCRQWISRRSTRSLATTVLAAALLISVVAWMLGGSALLPGHDPIATPTFAQLIREHGGVPPTQAPLDGRAWYYPPGFAVLLACVNWLPPLTTLWVFKLVDVVVIGLTPLAWLLAVRRLVLHRIDFGVAAAACVFGFVLFDRTLYLTPAFAGKNSQLLAAALLPITFEVVLATRRSWMLLPIAVLGIAGGILIHFSTIYMLAALIALWLVARCEWKPIVLARLVIAFVLGVLLTAPRLLASLHEHPDVRPIDTPYAERWAVLLESLLGEHSHGLFIFEDLGIRWPYKGLVLSAMAGVAVLMFVATPRSSSRLKRAAWVSALASLVAIGLLLVFAGVLPVPVSSDFARWFLYNFVALAGAIFFVAVVRLVERRGRPWPGRVLAAAVAVALISQFCAATWVQESTSTDIGRVARIARAEHFSNREVARVFEQLRRWHPKSCALVSRGTPLVGGRVVQNYKPLEYVRAFSPCYLANGSWLAINSGIDPTCDGEASDRCAAAVMRAHPNDEVYVVEERAGAPDGADLSISFGPYYLRKTH